MAKVSKLAGIGGTGGSLNLGSLLGGNAMGGLSKAFSMASSAMSLISAISKASTSTNKIINYRYRYNVKKLQALFPNEDPVDIIPNAVKAIFLTWMYDDCLHPIMQISLMLPPKLYNKIIDNKNEVKFVMRLQNTAYDMSNSPVMSDDVINATFGLIMDDEVKYPEEASYDEHEKMSPGEFNQSDYNTEYSLTFWKQNDLEAMRKVVNTIVNDSDVSTAMRKIFGEAGFEKIVMSPLDNNAKYDQIIIMPTNIMNIPDYFQQAYGTYYSGTQMFCDFDRLYIQNKNGICDAFEDGEYKRTIFVIKKTTDNDSKKAGTAEDSQAKVYYMFVNTMDIDTQSPSNSQDMINGNNVTIINSNANETMDVEGAGEQKGQGNSRVISDNYGNDFNKTVVLSDINERNNQIKIKTSDYRTEALTPNKEIVVVFEEPEKQSKNGFYRITKSVAVLSKEDNDLICNGIHDLVFKRALTSDESKAILVAVTQKNNGSNSGGNSFGAASGSSGTSPSVPTPGTPKNDYPTGKVSAPKPRLQGIEQEEIIRSNNVTPEPVKQDPEFNYDELGNVKGIDIPEYNKIKEDDDASVRRAKQEAQAKRLPCKGPKPVFGAA